MKTLSRLLDQTRRTFALSIPRLPAPTGCEATAACLLMRLADGLEDTPGVPSTTRIDGCPAGTGAFNHVTVDLASSGLDVIEARGAGAGNSRGAVADSLRADV